MARKGSTRRALVGPPLLYTISCFASLGVFLFGYDQGVMSGVITGPYFQSFFMRPTPYELATMVSILEIGAFMTSLLAGHWGDKFGRRRTLFWGASIFTLGGVIQTLTTGFPMMVFGRIISGAGVGFLSMIVPVYQAEVSPAENRGKLACIEFTGNIIGYSSSIWIDYLCSYISSDLSWRIPLSLQAVIGAFLAVGSLAIPESPRWLLDVDQDEDGMRVIADIHGMGDPEDEAAKDEFRLIKEGVLADRAVGPRSYKIMWQRYRGRILIAMSAQAFAQLNGINIISYYAPLVFEEAGWIGRDAILMTGINSLVYVASTIPPWYLVDVWGRRPILMFGSLLMGVALMLVGMFMYLDTAYTPVAVVALVIIYNAAFGFSWGPIPWLFPPEIMPTPYRVRGVALSTATNWLMNYLVGATTPILQTTIKWRMYPMFSGFCLTSFVLVYFTYPETCGVPLEDMGKLFEDAVDEKEQERLPIARAVSPNPSFAPEDLEPPAISPAPDNVLGRLFGSEINLRPDEQKGNEQGYSSGRGYSAVASGDDEEANSQRR